MTKEKYHNIANNLLLITLLSTIVCLFITSYLPLIITSSLFIGFLIYARLKFNYKAIEIVELKNPSNIDLEEYETVKDSYSDPTCWDDPHSMYDPDNFK